MKTWLLFRRTRIFGPQTVQHDLTDCGRYFARVQTTFLGRVREFGHAVASIFQNPVVLAMDATWADFAFLALRTAVTIASRLVRKVEARSPSFFTTQAPS